MDFGYQSLGYYNFPFVERSYPEASVVLSSNQMSPSRCNVVPPNNGRVSGGYSVNDGEQLILAIESGSVA
jgi:hypothetical protein